MPAPWGANVTSVRLLLGDVAPGEGLRPAASAGVKVVSDATILEWIDEGASRCELMIQGYERLPPVLRENVERTARGAVQYYAASLLAAVQNPANAGGGLADMLLARYDTALADLNVTVADELERLGNVDGVDPLTGMEPSVGADCSTRPISNWMGRGF